MRNRNHHLAHKQRSVLTPERLKVGVWFGFIACNINGKAMLVAKERKQSLYFMDVAEVHAMKLGVELTTFLGHSDIIVKTNSSFVVPFKHERTGICPH